MDIANCIDLKETGITDKQDFIDLCKDKDICFALELVYTLQEREFWRISHSLDIICEENYKLGKSKDFARFLYVYKDGKEILYINLAYHYNWLIKPTESDSENVYKVIQEQVEEFLLNEALYGTQIKWKIDEIKKRLTNSMSDND